MRALLSLLLLLAACSEDRRFPTGPVTPMRCTSGVLRCSGTNLERCNPAGAFFAMDRCGDAGKICGTVTGTIVGCIDDRCSTGTTGGRCNDGSTCTMGSECVSGGCSPGGTCVPATCGNQRQDGMETGVDCGGTCPACFGGACSANAQCVTSYCKRGMCDEPSCTDSETNGTETAPDCGGARCPACAVGLACRVPADCTTARCQNDRCADLDPSCLDGRKNGGETDSDCGGSDCAACALGKDCRADGDCISAWCNLGRCDRPTCTDGILNQGETDVDCGGPSCGGCDDGRDCAGNADCGSNRCERGACSSCMDGVRNGGEGGTDCGGPCAPCGDGQACMTSNDCGGGLCEGGFCCTPNACGRCGLPPFEMCNGVDDDCNRTIDDVGSGALCPLQQGACAGTTARCGGSSGWICDATTYRANNPAYASTDVSCDGVDNDCNGQTDEIPCPSDGTVCTSDTCDRTTRSCGTPVTNGTSCEVESPVQNVIEATHYNCLRGNCQQAPMWCQCYQNNGGCNCYILINGSTDVIIANSIACNGSNLDYRSNMMNQSRFCPNGCFRDNPPGVVGHWTCF